MNYRSLPSTKALLTLLWCMGPCPKYPSSPKVLHGLMLWLQRSSMVMHQKFLDGRMNGVQYIELTAMQLLQSLHVKDEADLGSATVVLEIFV